MLLRTGNGKSESITTNSQIIGSPAGTGKFGVRGERKMALGQIGVGVWERGSEKEAPLGAQVAGPGG